MSEADSVRVILGLLGPVSGVVVAILILALVGMGTYLRRYLEQKALQLATREDFDRLQAQVADSTRLVEGIKSELANNDWVKRELHNLSIRKIEELVSLALNCYDDVDAYRNAAIEGRHYGQPLHDDRMLTIAAVYLPELYPVTKAYRVALSTHYQQISRRMIEASQGGGGAWDDFMLDSNFREVRITGDALASKAGELLQKIARGTVFR